MPRGLRRAYGGPPRKTQGFAAHGKTDDNDPTNDFHLQGLGAQIWRGFYRCWFATPANGLKPAPTTTCFGQTLEIRRR